MNWIKLVIFNLIITFLLGELILRFIYTPQILDIRISLNKKAVEQTEQEQAIFDFNKLRFEPNSINKIIHSEYSISTTHDAIGFRNPCYSKINKKNFDLFIGDSFVYGVGLSNQYTYNCLLKNMGISVYTMGVPGAYVDHYVKVFDKNIESIRTQLSNPRSVYILLFLGNDFESLINYGTKKLNDSKSNQSIANDSKSNQSIANDSKSNQSIANIFLQKKNYYATKAYNFLPKMNYYVTKKPYFNESYFLNGIKLLLKPIFVSSDRGSHVVTNAGSTLYKFTTKQPVDEISTSLSIIKKKLKDRGVKLGGFFLIEDAAIIDSNRFKRDLLLANIENTEIIDINFKTDAILAACKISEVSCFDSRKYLSGNDYYIYDNHLNDKGAEKLAKFLSIVVSKGN